MLTKQKNIFIILSMLTFFTLLGANKDQNKNVFMLKSGDYAVDITKECKYSIRSIKYQDYMIASPTGYYGSVIKGKNFIGTGHTEGGEEQVQSIEFFVDGKKIKPKTNATYSGKRITLKKISKLDKILLTATITLTPDGITDQRSFEVLGSIRLYRFYVFMYCFTVKTKEYMAVLPNGEIESGYFKGDNKSVIEKDVRWMAQFDPDAEKGILTVFAPRKIWDVKIKDVPSHYHKLYTFYRLPHRFKKGFKSPKMTVIVKGFSSSPDKWKKTSKEAALKIEKTMAGK